MRGKRSEPIPFPTSVSRRVVHTPSTPPDTFGGVRALYDDPGETRGVYVSRNVAPGGGTLAYLVGRGSVRLGEIVIPAGASYSTASDALAALEGLLDLLDPAPALQVIS